MKARPPGAEPTKSQLLPVQFNMDELRSKPYFLPGVVCAGFIVALVWLINSNFAIDVPIGIVRGKLLSLKVPAYIFAIALFYSAATLFLLYKMVGKRMNPWFYAGMAVLVAYLCHGVVWDTVAGFIRGTFGSGLPRPTDNFLTHYWKMFIAAGVTEEVFKALPLLALAALGASKLHPWNERFGLREPLDGILLGVAAGVGFAFHETMFQYIRDALLQGGLGAEDKFAAVFAGTKAFALLFVRLVSDIFGHSAYAGYMGYFIGLACLYPNRRWKLLGIGLLSAAALHALWNSADKLGLFFYFVAAVLSFAMLCGAIIKARQLSPRRSELMPSQLLDGIQRGAAATPAAPIAAAKAPAPTADSGRSITWSTTTDLLAIEVGTARVPVTVGARVYERQAPGTTASRGDGIVAEVSANPTDATMLGIKNLSNQIWLVTTDTGERRELAPGRSIRVTRGTQIQLGDLLAEVK